MHVELVALACMIVTVASAFASTSVPWKRVLPRAAIVLPSPSPSRLLSYSKSLRGKRRVLFEGYSRFGVLCGGDVKFPSWPPGRHRIMPLTRSQIRRKSQSGGSDKDDSGDAKLKGTARKSAKRKKASKAQDTVNEKGAKEENGASQEGKHDEEGTDTVKKSRSRRSSTPRSFPDLARRREGEVLQNSRETAIATQNLLVVGIDEAGRGPLAGPVVAAAVSLLDPVAEIPVRGITDSKKITNPSRREELFQAIAAVGPHRLRWAAAVVDAARIDEINILQAALEAMTLACTALTCPSNLAVPTYSTVSADVEGSYVVKPQKDEVKTSSTPEANHSYFALVDGNRLPQKLPEPVVGAEAMVSGDSREYCIAAASIVAKVLRDQLMDLYHDKFCSENDSYQWDTNRGYPTAAHVDAIHRLGRVSPIHRRTFAPLKHMQFDDEGNIVKTAIDKDDEDKS